MNRAAGWGGVARAGALAATGRGGRVQATKKVRPVWVPQLDYNRTPCKERLLLVLRHAPEPVVGRQLARWAGVGTGRAEGLLAELRGEGIVRCDMPNWPEVAPMLDRLWRVVGTPPAGRR